MKILDLDFRIKENQDIIQDKLRTIKPFKKCQEGQNIEIEKLEKCIHVLCKNYGMFITLHADCFSSDEGIIWRLQLFDGTNLNELGKCYGLSMYELMCKSTLMCYKVTRKREKYK